MEVREIYKISDMIHKAAGWKKENVFLFLNTIFWAVLAFVIGAAAFTFDNGNDSRTWCKFILYYRICRNDNRIFWRKLLSLQKRMSCYLIH